MKEKLSNAFRSTKYFIGKHSPEILTGVGIAGMVTSTVLAVKATPKALELIEEAKDNSDNPDETLHVKDVIKVAWKPYIPAVSLGIASIACLISASTVSAKRNAALATAYTLSEKALLTYKDKVIETIGEKKEKAIREKIAQDEVDKKQVSDAQVIITQKGNTLCMDSITGRIFESDVDVIKKAVNEINRQVLCQNYVSLNEFYSLINLDSIPNGDLLGWNIDDGMIEIDFHACIVNDDKPCIVLDYSVEPKYEFDKFA